MSWESELFAVLDDLEGQAAAAFTREREAELADRRRSEYAAVPLAARLMASVDRPVLLEVVGVGTVRGTLVRVASGWCLVEANGAEWIVVVDAVAAVGGASDRAVPEVAWPALSRLGLGSALRTLADGGERCVVRRRDGPVHDGALRRVGSDFVEVLTGEPARVVLVAFSALAAVQSQPTS